MTDEQVQVAVTEGLARCQSSKASIVALREFVRELIQKGWSQDEAENVGRLILRGLKFV